MEIRIAMDLTRQEAEIITRRRAEIEAQEIATQLQRVTLRLVGQWAEWREKNGYGLTFSVFLDHFDCDQYIPDHLKKYRKQIYEMVGDASSSVHRRCHEIVGEDVL